MPGIVPKLHVDWQSQSSTILERNCHMFNNPLMSDIKLTCVATKGTTTSNHYFHAHKYVLATSSPVFFAMFFGNLAERDPVIHLPDVDYESLGEFLRFLYTEECTLTRETAVAVMYLAKKYIVPSLVKQCVDVIADCMCSENVLAILQQMILFDEVEMQDKCWGLIDRDTLAVVTSDPFAELSYAMLVLLLQRGKKLSIMPIEMLHAVLFWTEKQCQKLGVETTDVNKRTIVGDAVFELCFQDMTLDELAQYVVPSGLLTDEEFQSLWDERNARIQTIAQTQSILMNSSVDWHCISRFAPANIRPPTSAWSYGSRPDRIAFQSSLPGVLHGIRLFGDDAESKYEVMLQVSGVCVAGTYVSGLDSRGVYGFDVMLKPPIAVAKEEIVTMEVYIQGPNTYYGDDGEALVNIGGAMVVFKDVAGASNGSGVRQGQFDCIMMSFV